METRVLNTFITVAEVKSFTRAAEILGYSQSTISFQIKQLESELGYPLFERINKSVRITDRGSEFLRSAHEINNIVKKVESENSDQTELSGQIRIAMSDSLCDWLLRNKYEDFCNKYPKVTMKINPSGSDEMFRLLNQNEVDLVCTLDKHIYNNEYVIADETTVETHFVTSPSSPIARCRKTLVIEDILREPLLLTEKGMSYRKLLDEKLAAMSLEAQPMLELGNTALLCQLASKGLGISFLPDYVTQPFVDSGDLTRLHPMDFTIELWKQLIYHKNKWYSPLLQAAISLCKG